VLGDEGYFLQNKSFVRNKESEVLVGRKSREKKERKEQPKGSAYALKASADHSQLMPKKPTFENSISYLPEPTRNWLKNSHEALLAQSIQFANHPQFSALAYVGGLVQRAEAMISEVNRFNRPDVPLPACKVGCSYCCHLPVLITKIEAEAIAEFVLDACPPERVSLLKSQLDHRTKERRSDPEKKLRCVFMTEGGNCGIYEIRPNACIGYTSFSVDDCRRTFEGENLLVPFAGIPMAVGLMLADIQIKVVGDEMMAGRRKIPTQVLDLGGDMNQMLQRELERRGIKALELPASNTAQ
jgi:Fe-S-cluster containining protein